MALESQTDSAKLYTYLNIKRHILQSSNGRSKANVLFSFQKSLTLEIGIKELVEEHAKTNRMVADLVTGINGINKKIDRLLVIQTQEPDTCKFKQIIEKSMQEIRLTISTSLNKHKPGRFQLLLESKIK